jgi:hypothetical protein
VSPGEEQLALALEGGAAFTLALTNQELMKPGDMNFERLGAGGHSEGAVGGTLARRTRGAASTEAAVAMAVQTAAPRHSHAAWAGESWGRIEAGVGRTNANALRCRRFKHQLSSARPPAGTRLSSQRRGGP